jgi:hypothetical protein
MKKLFFILFLIVIGGVCVLAQDTSFCDVFDDAKTKADCLAAQKSGVVVGNGNGGLSTSTVDFCDVFDDAKTKADCLSVQNGNGAVTTTASPSTTVSVTTTTTTSTSTSQKEEGWPWWVWLLIIVGFIAVFGGVGLALFMILERRKRESYVDLSKFEKKPVVKPRVGPKGKPLP